MINRIATTLLVAITAVCTYAQAPSVRTDANIQGHVIDAENGEHLPFCAIRILETSIGVTTDASGHYAIHDLKPGKYKIEVSYVGYQSSAREVDVVTGKTTEVNFSIMPDAFQLDHVVVTSSKSEQKRRNSPALVNIVGGKTLGVVNACTLADGLSFQPGVRVENDCQNCGFTQVRINGLDGHYSQILMNSRPVFSALAGVYGLEHIPANMIDRVEVMRGGGSALFGSSAVGGTINIITKDPATNSAEVSHMLNSVGMSGALDNNTTFNASLVTKNSRAGMFIYGQSRSRDGYDHNGDGFTELATLSSRTLGIRSFVRSTDYTRLSLEYHTTGEYRRGGDQLDQPAHQAMIAEQVDHNIHSGETTFDWYNHQHDKHLSVYAATQSTRRKSYYGSHQDPDAYGRTTDLTVDAGSQYTWDINRLWFMPAQFIAGIEYNYNRLHDVSIGYNRSQLQNVNIYSGYVQNEWRDDRWGFLVGARLDKHSLINNPVVSPRVNVRFNPSRDYNFRLSYSTGFRSPQTYDEDFHIAIVGGDRVVTVLAPGLKAERSQSVSASADMYHRFGNVQTNLLVEGFFTDLKDAFALRRLEQPDNNGNAVLERYNGGGARVFGLNIEGKAAFTSHFDAQMGVTLQSSRYKQEEQWSENPDVAPVKRMFRTPDAYGYFTATYKPTARLSFAASGTVTGEMTVQHMQGSGTDVDTAVKTPAFFDMSLKAVYLFTIMGNVNLETSLGVSNIFNAYQKDFDLGADRDSGYMYGPAMPRSVSVSVKISI